MLSEGIGAVLGGETDRQTDKRRRQTDTQRERERESCGISADKLKGSLREKDRPQPRTFAPKVKGMFRSVGKGNVWSTRVLEHTCQAKLANLPSAAQRDIGQTFPRGARYRTTVPTQHERDKKVASLWASLLRRP